MSFISALAAFFAVAQGAFAEISMPAIFSDNMLVQRDMPVRIWGKAAPDALVKVEFAGRNAEVKAGADGGWKVELAAQKGSFVPREIVVYENGKVAKKIANVLVGEVWIAGGQSNMEFALYNCLGRDQAKNDADKFEGKFRYFRQRLGSDSMDVKSDFPEKSCWFEVNSKTATSTSGVGFFFAQKLLERLDCPVAVLYASKGATCMATWVSEEFTNKNPFLRAEYEQFKKELAKYSKSEYEARRIAHKELMDKVKRSKLTENPISVAWEKTVAPNPVSPRHLFVTPTFYYNCAIAPFGDLSVRGVIWYQGESDSHARLIPQFTRSFKSMIDCWRAQFKNPNLPFLTVQIVSYENRNDWPATRQQQFLCSKLFNNVYMASTIDCGEKTDIHPKDKKTVGVRLADIALQKIYKMSDVYSDAPQLGSVGIAGNKVLLNIGTFGRGLQFRGEPRGFDVCVDGKWVKPVSVKLDGDVLTVEAAEGAKITGVRYAWKNWAQPEVCLFNRDGLPLIPFSY